QRRGIPVPSAIALAAGELGRAAERVEDLELGRADGQPAVLVLPVEREEPPAQLAQVRRRGRAPLDEGAGSALGAHPPAENDLLRALVEPLAQVGQRLAVERAWRELEDALHVRLARAGAHDP